MGRSFINRTPSLDHIFDMPVFFKVNYLVNKKPSVSGF